MSQQPTPEPGVERVLDDIEREAPVVGILMGSESDREVMQAAADELTARNILFEWKVLSAHRNPDDVRDFAVGAEGRGMKVIIAGAGKAAALPGVVASFTQLPVIGVPIRTSDLGGLDSLLSIVQMPSGVPVACVAINGARNAAILAAQILRVCWGGDSGPAVAEQEKDDRQTGRGGNGGGSSR
jgi:5-(carboxyamino)imidazole ribonucleotide mutase